MNPDRSSISTSILDRARAGDEDAWNQISRLCSPIVLGRCIERLPTKDDARDVVQEIFLEVHRRLPTFQKSEKRHSFLRLVHSIATGKIADYYRQRHNETLPAGGSANDARLHQIPDVDFGWDVSDFRKEVYVRAVKLMETDFQFNTYQCFVLSSQGVPVCDIAEKLSLSETAVRTYKTRVKKRLQRELAGLLDLDSPDSN